MATIEIRRLSYDPTFDVRKTEVSMSVPFSSEAWMEAAKTLYERRFDLAHVLLGLRYSPPWTIAVNSIFAVLITDDENEWGIDDFLEIDFTSLTQEPNEYIPPRTVDEVLLVWSDFFD